MIDLLQRGRYVSKLLQLPSLLREQTSVRKRICDPCFGGERCEQEKWNISLNQKIGEGCLDLWQA